MKIVRIFYASDHGSDEVLLPADQVMTAVVSNYEAERRLLLVGAELALFKVTEDPHGYLVKASSITFDNGIEYEYPFGRLSKEGKLPFDHQQYVDHVYGQGPVDIIECVKQGTYRERFNVFLKTLSGGWMRAIRWDREMGLVIEHQKGVMRSVFAMSPGELETIKLAGRLVDFEQNRYPAQIFTDESLGLLDPDHMVRFCAALQEALRPNSQFVFLGKLMDVLGSPLATLQNIPIIDLDNKEA